MSKTEKKIKEKKQKKQKEIYIPKTGLMGNATDYHVYNMNTTERTLGFLVGGGATALVLYIFFGNIIVSAVAFFMAGIKAIPIYQNMLCQKRKKNLTFQFKDMLESLTSSYSAGKNTRDSFLDTLSDLQNMYGDDSDIVKELKIIVIGMDNNVNVEKLLLDFADRSESADIQSFADVFDVSLRQGADIKRIISTTRDIINDKLEMALEMNAMLSSNKNELHVVMLMPLLMSVTLSGMGEETFGNSATNIIAKIVAIIIFIIAYAMGKKITDIKI